MTAPELVIRGGDGLEETGGNVFVVSGVGLKSTSGNLVLGSANAGSKGVSGSIKITSGFALSNSGRVRLYAGQNKFGTGTSWKIARPWPKACQITDHVFLTLAFSIGFRESTQQICHGYRIRNYFLYKKQARATISTI